MESQIAAPPGAPADASRFGSGIRTGRYSAKMEAMTRWAIGIDLGGTNVRAAALEHDGTLLDVIAEPIERREHPPLQPFAQIIRLVERLVAGAEGLPSGIGIGSTGPVYPVKGVIDNPFTLPPNLQGNVRDAVEAVFPVPVALENDANAAALGEYWQGVGRGADALVCVTVGTGIGVGTVLHGVVHRGADGTHPEAGHQIVDPSGPRCYCGTSGCVESLAAGPSLVEAARSQGVNCASASEVFARAHAGDAVCTEVTRMAREAIAAVATNLVATHAADVIVLSGGALGDPAHVVAHVQRVLDAHEFGPPNGTRVCLAQLSDLAGCYGAAFVAVTASSSSTIP